MSKHSSLLLFQKPSVLVDFEGSQTIETYPISGGVDSPTIEFVIRTDRNIFIDLRSIEMEVIVSIQKITGEPLASADSKVFYISNTMHSLFANCEVLLNNELVETSNGLYAHKAYITSEWSHSAGCKNTVLKCQGYRFDPNPSVMDEQTVKLHNTGVGLQKTFFGKLAVDFLSCDSLLVPKTEIRIRLTKNKPEVVLQHPDGDSSYTYKFHSVKLFSRHMQVTESVWLDIAKERMQKPAKYVYPSMDAKTFIIPAHQNLFIRENIFNSKPIRSLAIAMNTNESFSGQLKNSPFHYQPFGLRSIQISRNGIPLVDVKTIDKTQVYFTTMKHLHFKEISPEIELKDYENHFLMCFDLTSTLESNNEVYYPELTGGLLRIELHFQKAITESIELLLLGEYLTTLSIKDNGEIVKDG